MTESEFSDPDHNNWWELTSELGRPHPFNESKLSSNPIYIFIIEVNIESSSNTKMNILCPPYSVQSYYWNPYSQDSMNLLSENKQINFSICLKLQCKEDANNRYYSIRRSYTENEDYPHIFSCKAQTIISLCNSNINSLKELHNYINKIIRKDKFEPHEVKNIINSYFYKKLYLEIQKCGFHNNILKTMIINTSETLSTLRLHGINKLDKSGWILSGKIINSLYQISHLCFKKDDKYVCLPFYLNYSKNDERLRLKHIVKSLSYLQNIENKYVTFDILQYILKNILKISSYTIESVLIDLVGNIYAVRLENGGIVPVEREIRSSDMLSEFIVESPTEGISLEIVSMSKSIDSISTKEENNAINDEMFWSYMFDIFTDYTSLYVKENKNEEVSFDVVKLLLIRVANNKIKRDNVNKEIIEKILLFLFELSNNNIIFMNMLIRNELKAILLYLRGHLLNHRVPDSNHYRKTPKTMTNIMIHDIISSGFKQIVYEEDNIYLTIPELWTPKLPPKACINLTNILKELPIIFKQIDNLNNVNRKQLIDLETNKNISVIDLHQFLEAKKRAIYIINYIPNLNINHENKKNTHLLGYKDTNQKYIPVLFQQNIYLIYKIKNSVNLLDFLVSGVKKITKKTIKNDKFIKNEDIKMKDVIQKIILEPQLCMLISKYIYNPKENLNSTKERIVSDLLNVIKSSKKIKCYKNVKKYFDNKEFFEFLKNHIVVNTKYNRFMLINKSVGGKLNNNIYTIITEEVFSNLIEDNLSIIIFNNSRDIIIHAKIININDERDRIQIQIINKSQNINNLSCNLFWTPVNKYCYYYPIIINDKINNNIEIVTLDKLSLNEKGSVQMLPKKISEVYEKEDIIVPYIK